MCLVETLKVQWRLSCQLAADFKGRRVTSYQVSEVSILSSQLLLLILIGSIVILNDESLKGHRIQTDYRL